MKVNQIYSILNDINEQHWGESGVAVTDLTGLISMGETVLSSDNNMDKFINSLVDRIGKTVVRTLDLELDFPNLFMDTFEFGAILQKISIKNPSSLENASWEIGSPNFEPTFANVNLPEISVRYFKDSTTWKFQITVPDYQIESAFVSAEAMDSFINGIISAMSDSMTMSINNMSRTAICNFIAEKVKAQNGVINLLTTYQTKYPNDSTVVDYNSAMESPTFLRFAGKTIRNIMRYMSRPSVLYNVTDDILRATSRDNMHVMLLTDFVSSYKTNYQSDSFNDEMVNLPLYQEVEWWQGSGDSVNEVSDMNTINVIPSSDKKEGTGGTAEPIEVTGVIGLLCDRQAIGVGLQKMKAGSWYNSIDHYSNQSRSALIQYYNDLTESGVIFIVEPTT